MLRRQVPNKYAELPHPVEGVNLRDAPHTLRQTEAVLMQNCYYDGGIRPIAGTAYLTGSALASATRVRGGARVYWATAGRSLKRLVAYSTKISDISDAGSETVIDSGMTADLETFFTTWSITDKVYITNATDTLRSYDNTTFATVTGTAIPVAKGNGVVAVLDRLFAITTNGIERTNPRVDNVWSTNSSWATFRPVKPGIFTALYPFSLKEGGTVADGALAFQSNAYYLLYGTNYGSDVTAASAPANLDAFFKLLDPTIGTSSPRSICHVPGVGIFWVTSDLNVYHLPAGSMTGFFVGDKLRATWRTTGLENANKNALDQIQIIYFDHKLILRFPNGNSTYNDREFWLDLRYRLSAESTQPVWYGPHNVTTMGVLWREDQSGELALKGGEGNASAGAYIYKAYQPDLASHTVGAASVYPTMQYQSPYNIGMTGGMTLKYLERVRLTAHLSGPLPYVGISDLNVATPLMGPVVEYDA